MARKLCRRNRPGCRGTNERLWSTVGILVFQFAVLCGGQMNYGGPRTTAVAHAKLTEMLHLPFKVSQRDNYVKLGMLLSVNIETTPWFNETFSNKTEITLSFIPSQKGILEPIDDVLVDVKSNMSSWNHTLNVHTLAAGQVTVRIVAENVSSPSMAFRVSVYKFGVLRLVSQIVGWLYFAAWSVSFYPQIYQNWRRHSVRGLSLDFVFLNWTGFVLYALFNIGLYAVPEIKVEYLRRNPTGLIPVQLNDLVFALHAVFACSVTCCQCIFFDKGTQTISKTGKTLFSSIFTAVFIMLVVTVSGGVLWLDFLTACSTIKLIITLVKYMPQAYLNYARKSTSGWSIGNVVLDMTGGILSMAQMIIIAYNSNDWISFFGDYTKFGLGAFSLIFDIIFMVQHYGLYRSHEAYEPIEGSTVQTADDQEDMVTSNIIQTTESEGDHERGMSSVSNG